MESELIDSLSVSYTLDLHDENSALIIVLVTCEMILFWKYWVTSKIPRKLISPVCFSSVELWLLRKRKMTSGDCIMGRIIFLLVRADL